MKIVRSEIRELSLMGIKIAFEDLLCGIITEQEILWRSRERKHHTCLFLKTIQHQGKVMSESRKMSTSGSVAIRCIFNKVLISCCACKLRKITL